MIRLFIIAMVLYSFSFADNTIDDFGDEISDRSFTAQSGRLIHEQVDSRNYVWENGPWFNSEGTGVGGANESILQSWGTVLGYGFQLAYDTKLADDFTIPTGCPWYFDKITVAGYQVGSGLTPTINGVFIAVYDDNPNTGTMVAGDPYTNVFTSAQWSGIYRVTESESGISAERPIMAVISEPLVTIILESGTYWISFQTDGSAGFSGPWHPPVVIWDVPETGNALQSTDGGVTWNPISNGNFTQGLVFSLEPCFGLQAETWGSIKTMF